MITTRFINPLTQFGRTEYELVHINESGEIIHRQWCKFPEGVTDKQLQAFAEKVSPRLKTESILKEGESIRVATVDKPLQIIKR